MDPEKSQTLQIVVAALMVGVGFFFCICLIIHGFNELIQWRTDSLTYVGGIVAFVCLVSSYIAARMLDRRAETAPKEEADRDELEERLWADYYRRTLVGCALLEGGIILNALLCVMRPNIMSLVAAVVLLFVMSFHFPTSERIQNWYTNRLIGIAKQSGASR